MKTRPLTVIVPGRLETRTGGYEYDRRIIAGLRGQAYTAEAGLLLDQADELVATADGLGGLSIVVNNAGITRDRMLFNMTDEDWDAVISVHLRGHFLLTRNAATYWRAKAKAAGTDGAGQVYGRIINTSSEAGLVGPVGQANYGAAKAGIAGMTRVVARELGKYGITVNAIAPIAQTRMIASVPKQKQARSRTRKRTSMRPCASWRPRIRRPTRRSVSARKHTKANQVLEGLATQKDTVVPPDISHANTPQPAPDAVYI